MQDEHTLNYEMLSYENRTPATKWQWNLFDSKVIARSVNTFTPLGDETISSSLVQRSRSLMYPPHPLLHFVVRIKLTSTNVFLQVAKKCGRHGERSGLYGGCWSVSQPNLRSLSLTWFAVWVRALSWKRMIPSDNIPGRFDFMACYSILNHQETNHHLSALLYLPPFTMLNEHTLHYSHLQSNKETNVWTCAFSWCMSPTLHMTVSIHNNSVASFCEECDLWRVFGFHLTALYIPAEKCSYRSIKKGNMFKAKTMIEKGGTRNLNQLPWST